MSTPRLTPNGKPLRGSAGALILKDLGLTDEALAAFLPADAPAWLRGVFWCHFTGPSSLEAIHQHFLTQAGGRFAVSQTVGLRFPPDGPEEGVAMPSIVLRPKGRYVTYLLYVVDPPPHPTAPTFCLEATFRAMGTDWGSNRAVYERFKAVELGLLGARDIVEQTD
jgi:hypothetical protein